MDPVTESVIARMVRTIVAAVDSEQIILFGSRARGNFRSDSDLDLGVIQGNHRNAGRTCMQDEVQIYKALKGFKMPADLLAFKPDDVEYWKDSKN